MVPEPTFSFTIPSIKDDTVLECRIYSPPHSIPNSEQSVWDPRGAVIAHPYAPLGGCFDDPVVLSAVAEILDEGFVVGTFNFRGAGASKGRTSWQAKAEVEDYISFAGFFIHYVQGLRVNPICSHSPIAPDLTLSPIQIPEPRSIALSPADRTDQGMLLILGGYSYGGLITTHLPTTKDILDRFETNVEGSAVFEIILRAVNLARQWNKDAEIYRKVEQARKPRSHERLNPSAGTMAMSIGGDESEQASRRPSHEGRLSMDIVRRSMERSRQKLGLRKHSHSSDMSRCTEAEEDLASTKIPLPRTCFLLISPPLPPVSMFITMFSGVRSSKSPDHKGNFTQNPTFAVYGDSDFFTSQRKYRSWAESLKAEPESQFQFLEVPGAGHFWREDGVGDQMRRSIRGWVRGLSSSIAMDR